MLFTTLHNNLISTWHSQRLKSAILIIFARWFRIRAQKKSRTSKFRDFAQFAKKPRDFAVFSKLNRRKQDRVVWFFLIAQVVFYDDSAKEKTQKSWKLDFWRGFEISKFKFFVLFWIFFCHKNIFKSENIARIYASQCYNL